MHHSMHYSYVLVQSLNSGTVILTTIIVLFQKECCLLKNAESDNYFAIDYFKKS